MDSEDVRVLLIQKMSRLYGFGIFHGFMDLDKSGLNEFRRIKGCYGFGRC